MLLDDDYEGFVTTPERIKALGFKPQKELLTNHLLPYADQLDDESQLFLQQVKTNLAKSVMLREMKPACGVWSSRLMKYIRIYGLKFGKEDHLLFIKLAYELVLIPDLEPCKVHKFATLFLMLTKKRFLISPEELTLPWRPLYDVGFRIFEKSSSSIGMYHYHTRKSENSRPSVLDMVRKFISGNGLAGALDLFGLPLLEETELPTSLESSYMTMIKCAKPYFPVGATKEILEELLPQICPWSSNSQMMGPFTTFLPVGLYPEHAEQGHLLWFDKLMDLWDVCYNNQCGISDVMMLFAGLAKRNPGAVDWTPHVPKMFMRFLHALSLPVSYKDMQYTKNHSLDMKVVASWIVWTINPDGVVLKHLRSFLAGVESYLQSANAGRWSFKLRDLLRKLAREFLIRVRREREKKLQETWENKTPEHYKLRDEDITEFVKIVLEPTLQAVYSRNGSLDISLALQNLSTLRPAIVIPPLIERLRTSLTSLTEPHRVTAAMTAVAAVARPMIQGANADYPEGPTHVVPFLMAVLPGLDPNDIKKTLVTLHFILIFSGMIPFIDCSTAHEHHSDLTEEELLVCESTAQFEDFILIFLDRIFVIIESSVTEHARLDTKDHDCVRSKTDAVMETAISSAATAVLTQCSPKIFKEALRKFKSFATETTFETNVSGSMVGVLLKVFSRIDSESTLAAFLPKLIEELTELLANDEVLKEENPPRDLCYSLVLFKQVIECNGTALLKYMPQIVPVLDRLLKLHATYALVRAADALAHIFVSLSYVDVVEWRSSAKDYGSAPEKWLPVREWGNGCWMQDANLKWHVPNADEAQCAQMLVDRYVKHEVTRLRQWLSGERDMSRERRIESQVPATCLPFINAVPHEVTLDGENMRVALTRLLVDVQRRLLDDKTDDTRGLETLIHVWERVVVVKGHRAGPGIEARLRSYNALERALDGRGGLLLGTGFGNGGDVTGSARLRMLVADAARLQFESRSDLVCDAGMTPTGIQALNSLFELSINTYSSVRILAQMRLYWMLSHFPYSYRVLVPKIVELLAKGGEGEEWHAKHKGILFVIMGPKVGPMIAKQDWDVVKALWPAVLKAPLSEKPSILRLEQAFSDCLHRQFPAVNTRLTTPESAVNVAKNLLREEDLNDFENNGLLEKAVQDEIATSDRIERVYNELVMELVEAAEKPNIQWRRLELAMQMLTYCPLVQTHYPARAVRLMVRSLLHDDIAVRRTAQKLTMYALKQRKNKIKKIDIDPYEFAGLPRPEKHIPGYRKDLEWAIWSEDKEIKSDEEWDRPWLRDYTFGFFAWPKKLKVAAPTSEQKYSLDTPAEEMEEGERYLFEFFSDDANIDRLTGFFTVEEKKGKDKFSGIRFSMFRMAFAQFGERVYSRLMSHAVRCAGDTQEAPQRFAAELAAAALRAPRYWPRNRALALQKTAMEVIKKGLTSVTAETMEDWGTCVATGVEKLDPIRGSEVLKKLLQLCAPPPAVGDVDPDHHTSFVVCARLYALQGALGSMTWRTAPLAADLLKRLDAANFIQHPYQNVRETVGSILMTIFDTELVFPGGSSGRAPRLEDFIAEIKPRLEALYDENGDIVIKTAASLMGPCASQDTCVSPAPPVVAGPAMPLTVMPANPHLVRLATDTSHAEHTHQTEGTTDPVEAEGDETRVDKQLVERLDTALRLSGDAAPAQRHHARAVNLLTTVLRACMGVIVRGVSGNTETHYELVSTACALAARGPPQPHEELPRAAGGFLASLALANHSYKAFDKALEVLESLAEGRSWWARLACLEFAQPLLFYGLPMLCAQADRAVRAERFALKLMRDPRVEVRQAAAKLLTGLMHCRALPDEAKTLKALTRSCRSKELVERHCGVLGLCGYLSSRPYSLGPRLGDVLAELARHTSAPDPIPATIRTALADFRRTHQDDWSKHREQLTEEELDLLADLTSPPSYCA
ncbi:proteasome activator complex subunit 4A-like isoform X2 [Pararge aegeria]|uniref:proteasome activator complex subunit 4A-like isoform X2 n=1 Tax=Pararge aegeria TaxID=116150 RepID=UPI0019D14A6B|nr:proteasome activator complex subunit 4A-like isoform X2 [Pararge aegeria]